MTTYMMHIPGRGAGVVDYTESEIQKVAEEFNDTIFFLDEDERYIWESSFYEPDVRLDWVSISGSISVVDFGGFKSRRFVLELEREGDMPIRSIRNIADDEILSQEDPTEIYRIILDRCVQTLEYSPRVPIPEEVDEPEQ